MIRAVKHRYRRRVDVWVGGYPTRWAAACSCGWSGEYQPTTTGLRAEWSTHVKEGTP